MVFYRVLCFGDSLTRGYFKMGFHHSPYSDTLEQLFIDNNLSAEIITKGVDGRFVDPEMVENLPSMLAQLQKIEAKEKEVSSHEKLLI